MSEAPLNQLGREIEARGGVLNYGEALKTPLWFRINKEDSFESVVNTDRGFILWYLDTNGDAANVSYPVPSSLLINGDDTHLVANGEQTVQYPSRKGIGEPWVKERMVWTKGSGKGVP